MRRACSRTAVVRVQRQERTHLAAHTVHKCILALCVPERIRHIPNTATHNSEELCSTVLR